MLEPDTPFDSRELFEKFGRRHWSAEFLHVYRIRRKCTGEKWNDITVLSALHQVGILSMLTT